MAIIPKKRRSLLSSNALVQAPFIKVTIGSYTFGVYKTRAVTKDVQGNYMSYAAQQFPNYVQSLSINKINGQVNQYTLTLAYPVRVGDDPNFMDKVFSAVSHTRKIVFSYGDSATPNFVYKDEEAIITKISHSFGFGQASTVITYTVEAVSSAALGKSGAYTFINSKTEKVKPSDIIKGLFRDQTKGLRGIFTGMTDDNLDELIDGSDKEVILESKKNIPVLDYINYLVSCMIPVGSSERDISKDIYVFTIHDDTPYAEEDVYAEDNNISGPYFKVTRVSYATKEMQSYSDAYEIDIGYATRAIVTNFSVSNNENYSIFYDYQKELHPEEYVRRLNDNGEFEDIFSPSFTTNNQTNQTNPNDITWYTKMTKFPISGNITIQGLLRPAMLMQYVRLNVIFPGGRKHSTSGLYIITSQRDNIDVNGYKTTLGLTRISGDENPEMYAGNNQLSTEDWLKND